LIEQGKVMTANNGTFRVLTERFAGGYTVTLTSCDCADFEARQATDPTPCKHQWAAIGTTAAMLIGDIRRATTLPELITIGKTYADAMSTLPEAFVKIARNEYRTRRDTLSHKDEEISILIKPQPKSNGNYGGVEI
jgi:hypothetical protein